MRKSSLIGVIGGERNAGVLFTDYTDDARTENLEPMTNRAQEGVF